MRRLAAVDWLLIGTFMPVLLFGVLMSVVRGLRGDFVFPPLFVSSAPDAQSCPIVRETSVSSSVAAGSIAVGDRVCLLDGADLRGVSAAGLGLRWSAVARSGARALRLTIERSGLRGDVLVPLIPGSIFPLVPWWVPLPLVLGLGVTALLLLVRAAHWRLARRVYLACALMACTFTPYFCVPTMPRVAITATVLGYPAVAGLVLWAVCELSPGARLWGPWQQALTWTLSLLLAASFAAMYWLPNVGLGAVLIRARGLATIGFMVTILVVLTLAYLRSDPLGRRQIKWIVYGSYVGLLPSAVFYAIHWLRV